MGRPPTGCAAVAGQLSRHPGGCLGSACQAENLRRHYALTLRDWCRNLVAHWDEAVAEVGLPTAKVWGLYMAGSRLGFETNVVQLHQVLAVKPDRRGGDGGLPLRPWWTP